MTSMIHAIAYINGEINLADLLNRIDRDAQLAGKTTQTRDPMNEARALIYEARRTAVNTRKPR